MAIQHCTCVTKTPEPKYHKHGCPVRKGIKFPRLFYYEDAVNSYIPAPVKVEEILNAEDNFLSNGDLQEITFVRLDMTDEEVDNLPVE
jgi:hypothetical protein